MDPRDKALNEIWKLVHIPTKESPYRSARDHYAADFDKIRKIIKQARVEAHKANKDEGEFSWLPYA